MSNFQLPTQKGNGPKFEQVTQQPTKLVVHGAGGDPALEQAVVDRYGGALRQFHSKQQQAYSLSENQVHKAYASIGDEAQFTYTNIHGQETLEIAVNASISGELRKQHKTGLDAELGGYIFFEIDRSVGDPYPVSFSVKLNGVELFGMTFSQARDNTFWGLVTFGKNALHYHSYNDAANEVTSKFISFPSPKYRDQKYVEGDTSFFYYTASVDENGEIRLPYYRLFNIPPGGELQARGMTYWDGAKTPVLTQTSGAITDYYYGGTKDYPQLGSSPLALTGQNKLTVETSSTASITGYIFGELFSRSTRPVNHSWHQTAQPEDTLYMNDQPVYFQAQFTNNKVIGRSGAGFDTIAQWWDCYNTLDGVIASPTSSNPNKRVDDPATPVTTLVLDLSK